MRSLDITRALLGGAAALLLSTAAIAQSKPPVHYGTSISEV